MNENLRDWLEFLGAALALIACIVAFAVLCFWATGCGWRLVKVPVPAVDTDAATATPKPTKVIETIAPDPAPARGALTALVVVGIIGVAVGVAAFASGSPKAGITAGAFGGVLAVGGTTFLRASGLIAAVGAAAVALAVVVVAVYAWLDWRKRTA